MNHFSLAHVPDPVLLVDLDNDHDREGIDTAWRLARIAETEARRLYLPAGYASMRDYCVGHLRLPREDAYKRVRVARAARKFPVILHGIAERKYHVSTLVILVPFLTRENADELLASAANQSRAGLERLVADRFPRPDFPAHFQVADPPTELILSEKMETSPNSLGENREVSISRGSVFAAADGRERPPEGTAVPPTPRAQIQPHSPGRVEWHLTVEQETQDLLLRAQELMSHQLPSREPAKIVHRALELLVKTLTKSRCGATDRPTTRRSRSTSQNPRYIPRGVKSRVWERDGGQCTFSSESGHRCPSRDYLEYDHIVPVARGGTATVENLRLRCRAHNQFEAERVYGREFMKHKREPRAGRRSH
jgi:5-methylcytosine-specific restriction endonuclease McrA